MHDEYSFIDEAVREKFEREKESNVMRDLAEGYKVRKSEDKQLALEWDKTSADGIYY